MLKSLQIGSVKIPHTIFLAPMSGVTDLPYRRLVKKYGAGLVFSEMIASQAMIRETRDALLRSKQSLEENPCALQLAGCDPSVMAEAAKLNEDRGVALIDINMGCPAKKVINGYAGSALMQDERHAAAIMRATVNAVKIPVTLKMRTGWNEANRNAPALAKIAQEEGIQLVTIHGRTRCQFYRGVSDWAFIGEVKEALTIPVIGNGDVRTPQDAQELLKVSGADGVMVGRGTYGRPWLLQHIQHYLSTGEELPEPSILEKKTLILEHLEGMLSHYGEHTTVRVARKHIAWYSKGLKDSAEFRSTVNGLETGSSLMHTIETYFDTLLQKDDTATEPLLDKGPDAQYCSDQPERG